MKTATKPKSYESYLRTAINRTRKDSIASSELAQAFLDSLSEMDNATEILTTMVEVYRANDNGTEMSVMRKLIGSIFYYELDDYIKQLVHKCAGEYLKSDPTIFDDICHECYLTVMDKMKLYDPVKSAPNTYFTQDIMHTIMTFNDKKFSNATAHYGFATKRLKKRIEELRANNITATAEGLARDLGISLTTVRGCIDIMNNSQLVYLDSAETEAEKNTLEGQMRNTSSPEQIYLDNEEFSNVKELLADLTPLQQKIVVFSVFHEMSNKDIAAKLNLPVGKVAQLYDRACAHLRLRPEFKARNDKFIRYAKEKNQRCANILLRPLKEDAAIRTEKYVISLFSEK